MAKKSSPAHPWRGGWYQGARQLQSPNHGSRPAGAAIDLIVVHSISLPPGEYGGQAVQQLFTNRLDWDAHPYFQSIRGLEVSAHFFIARDGRLWQFVDTERRAWHAGRSHYRGRDGCNDDSIGVELEGLEGEAFEAPQYLSLLRLCKALTLRYPIGYIAGHEHIAPHRKNDPGPGFEWQRLQSAFAGSGILFPPTIRAA
ncbi:MAG: 1,6-anhydro-N-acetylmuramyl-L-alanine amidase AmpD [Comamonadaceae bacterium]|nr:1,6-anhydro-N-acetylmuramyl-L-alanine amidase AmpD [Pseudomonadota bacterium]MBS0611338.1 1,6-anhydro-N-acetylmuramyl-L-alanine amidase AmpD [Pseudomonadota bacterium]MDE2415991.1 1,6-anhydro-N-acetylmuramyl-L-alanine amidase AmpD [Comamonadaceae bacterium]